MKTMFSLTAALIAVILSVGVSDVKAGAYNTGNGHGYSAYASTEIVPKGTLFIIARLLPHVRPAPDVAGLCQRAFTSTVQYMPEMKIWL